MLTYAKITIILLTSISFLAIIISKGGRMVNIEQEKLNEAGHLLLEVKCLARLGALASESCIDDNELQLQDNLEYYFVLRQIVNLVNKIEKLIQD